VGFPEIQTVGSHHPENLARDENRSKINHLPLKYRYRGERSCTNLISASIMTPLWLQGDSFGSEQYVLVGTVQKDRQRS